MKSMAGFCFCFSATGITSSVFRGVFAFRLFVFGFRGLNVLGLLGTYSGTDFLCTSMRDLGKRPFEGKENRDN